MVQNNSNTIATSINVAREMYGRTLQRCDGDMLIAASVTMANLGNMLKAFMKANNYSQSSVGTVRMLLEDLKKDIDDNIQGL